MDIWHALLLTDDDIQDESAAGRVYPESLIASGQQAFLSHACTKSTIGRRQHLPGSLVTPKNVCLMILFAEKDVQ